MKRKGRRMFKLIIPPFKQSLLFFAVLAIRFMVCQKSAMHVKLPLCAFISTCLQPFSLLVSQWAKLQSQPESCVLPSRETKGWFSLRPVSRFLSRQHGSLGQRHQTWLDQKSSQRDNGSWVKENVTTVDKPSSTTTPMLSKDTFNLRKGFYTLVWPGNQRAISLRFTVYELS